jgi:hypothetical protein
MSTIPPDQTNPKDLIGITKAPLRFVPPVLMVLAAPAMADGAKKYGPYNWREKKVRLSVYLEAILRHLLAYADGEDDDQDSGHLHLSHIAANVGILADALYGDNLLDDRPVPGPAPKMMKELAVGTKKADESEAAPDLPPHRPYADFGRLEGTLEERLRKAEEDQRAGGKGSLVLTQDEYLWLQARGLIDPNPNAPSNHWRF